MSRKILVTGAAGFIGSQLSWDLHRDGHEVVMIDDMSFGYEDNLVVDGQRFGSFHKADIRDPGIAPLFEGVDAVFHFAGISALPVNQENPYYAIDVNVAGTAQVLELARKAGVRRVVFASTSAIYENNTEFPCRENDPVAPNLVYSTSKLQSELLCKSFYRTYGMETVIVRYYNVYGPHQDFKRMSPPLTSYVVRELLAGRPPVLHSSGDQKRDYIHVADVNRLNRICMDHPGAPGEIFNAASGSQVSVKEIFEILSTALGTNIRSIYRPAAAFWDKYPGLFAGNYPLPKELIEKEVDKFTLGSNDKARSILGWKPEVTLVEGMAEMARYAQSIA